MRTCTCGEPLVGDPDTFLTLHDHSWSRCEAPDGSIPGGVSTCAPWVGWPVHAAAGAPLGCEE